jgi:hypothetical protein
MSVRITVTGTILVQPSGSDRGESSSLNIGDTVTMREFSDARSRSSYRVATSGALGSVFEALDTPAVNEQLVLMSGGSEVCVRLNGVVARVTSSSLAGYGTIANLDAFTLGIDSVNHAIVFQTGDTTAAKIAARINSIVGAIVATVSSTGLLVIAGSKTGDADAKAASMQYGEVALTDGVGAPLAKLGLTAGTTNGKGKDLRFTGRFFIEPPSSGVGAITSVELSGSAEIVTHVAGRAS